jgi:hypothetical protein
MQLADLDMLVEPEAEGILADAGDEGDALHARRAAPWSVPRTAVHEAA